MEYEARVVLRKKSMVMKKQPECEEVGLWLQGSLGYEQSTLLSRLRKHAVSCSRCRSMLFLTHFELMGRPQPQYRFISCDLCQQDLAAYIDIMQDQGERAAAQLYPHVWWHLWTCEECLEIFEETLTLAQHFRFNPIISFNNIIPAITCKEKEEKALPSFTLPRYILAYTFQQNVASGPHRTNHREEVMLYELEEIEHGPVSVYLADLREQHCDLRIVVSSATQGYAHLELGSHHFDARFDHEGSAKFIDIPVALLSDQEGPDLIFSLELDALD
jgi:hypothetical protein